MNAKNYRFSNQLALMLVLSAALLSVFAQPANAHKTEYRPPISNHYYYQHGRRFVFPRWLRKDIAFQRWYVRSDYRFIRGANWNTLYDMYRFEKRRYRKSHRRQHRRVYIDYDRVYRRRHR